MIFVGIYVPPARWRYLNPIDGRCTDSRLCEYACVQYHSRGRRACNVREGYDGVMPPSDRRISGTGDHLSGPMGQQKVKCIPGKPLRHGAIHTRIRCNEKCIPNRKMSRRSELDSTIDELKKKLSA